MSLLYLLGLARFSEVNKAKAEAIRAQCQCTSLERRLATLEQEFWEFRTMVLHPNLQRQKYPKPRRSEVADRVRQKCSGVANPEPSVLVQPVVLPDP